MHEEGTWRRLGSRWLREKRGAQGFPADREAWGWRRCRFRRRAGFDHDATGIHVVGAEAEDGNQARGGVEVARGVRAEGRSADGRRRWGRRLALIAMERMCFERRQSGVLYLWAGPRANWRWAACGSGRSRERWSGVERWSGRPWSGTYGLPYYSIDKPALPTCPFLVSGHEYPELETGEIILIMLGKIIFDSAFRGGQKV